MASMLARRVPKDIELLSKNKEHLAEKGIYFHFFDDDLTRMLALITPRHKSDAASGLVSPYTGGFFLFEIKFPENYPMVPPKLQFHPQSTACRFHPNYYSTGKVCLSIINTWGSEDWSPSMSLMALLVTLEERFFEMALGCEPGHERSPPAKHKQYNDFVEYNKYKIAIINVVRGNYPIFNPFNKVIEDEFKKNKAWHLARIEDTLMPSLQGKNIAPPCYGGASLVRYDEIRNMLNTLCN